MSISIDDYSDRLNYAGFDVNLQALLWDAGNENSGFLSFGNYYKCIKISDIASLKKIELAINNFVYIDETDIKKQSLTRFRDDFKILVYLADDTVELSEVDETDPETDLESEDCFKVGEYSSEKYSDSRIITVQRDNRRTIYIDLDTIKADTGISTDNVNLYVFVRLSGSLNLYGVEAKTKVNLVSQIDIIGSAFFFSVASNNSLPAGTILMFGGSIATVPDGFLACFGASLVRTEYVDLFSAIGTAWGAVDSTHFNAPDLRGRFLRGVDHGQGVDPDVSSRTAIATGGNTGDNVGSVQDDENKEHNHDYVVRSGAGGSIVVTTWGAYEGTQNYQTLNSGGNESRPKNAFVEYIIKY